MRLSMSGRAPVSSPTSTIETTIGGNCPEASIEGVMLSPSFTASWMSW